MPYSNFDNRLDFVACVCYVNRISTIILSDYSKFELTIGQNLIWCSYLI